jgi:hypothetical protein
MKIASLWQLDGDSLELRSDLERSGDPELKQLVLGFLAGGDFVLRSPALREDRLDPSRTNVVPLGYLSDGEWIWPLEMSYYLEQHDILPEQEFHDHMRAHNYQAPEPDPMVLAEAAQLLTEG